MSTRIFVTYLASAALLLSGCAQRPSGSTQQDNGSDLGSTISKTVAGILGAGVGVLAAEKLAESEGKRRKLTRAEIDKLKRGYTITFALLGGAGGAALGGTVYGKLTENGRKEREQAMLNAALHARPQRYGDPDDPTLKGVVTPGKRYTDASGNRECVDEEDALSDRTSKDAIFAKWCRDLPTGTWKEVTV